MLNKWDLNMFEQVELFCFLFLSSRCFLRNRSFSCLKFVFSCQQCHLTDTKHKLPFMLKNIFGAFFTNTLLLSVLLKDVRQSDQPSYVGLCFSLYLGNFDLYHLWETTCVPLAGNIVKHAPVFVCVCVCCVLDF